MVITVAITMLQANVRYVSAKCRVLSHVVDTIKHLDQSCRLKLATLPIDVAYIEAEQQFKNIFIAIDMSVIFIHILIAVYPNQNHIIIFMYLLSR